MTSIKFKDVHGDEVVYNKKGIIILLKQEYIRRKSELVGKSIKLSPRTPASVWEQAADHCIELQASPRMFVKAAFDKCTLLTGPYPNMMGSKKAVQWYESYLRENNLFNSVENTPTNLTLRGEGHYVDFEYDVEKLNQIIRIKAPTPSLKASSLENLERVSEVYAKRVEDIVNDELISVSTISRAVVAFQFGLHDLAKMLFNSALETAHTDPALRKAIEEFYNHQTCLPKINQNS